MKKFSSVSFFFLLLAATIAVAQEKLPQFLKHTVKAGETLNSIAAQYRVNKKDLCLLNDFPENKKVSTGEVILIKTLTDKEARDLSSGTYSPTVTAKPKTEPARPTKTETQPTKEVVKKETPPVKTEEKKTTAAAPAPSTQKVETGPGGTKYNVSSNEFHTVEKGQTFYRIALIYGLTVDELKQLNYMSTTDISVGQKLRVRK